MQDKLNREIDEFRVEQSKGIWDCKDSISNSTHNYPPYQI